MTYKVGMIVKYVNILIVLNHHDIEYLYRSHTIKTDEVTLITDVFVKEDHEV